MCLVCSPCASYAFFFLSDEKMSQPLRSVSYTVFPLILFPSLSISKAFLLISRSPFFSVLSPPPTPPLHLSLILQGRAHSRLRERDRVNFTSFLSLVVSHFPSTFCLSSNHRAVSLSAPMLYLSPLLPLSKKMSCAV